MMVGQGISVTTRFFKARGFALFIRAGLLDVCLNINQLYFVLYLHLIWDFGPKSITLTKSFVNA
jgi:hypothetical protein